MIWLDLLMLLVGGGVFFFLLLPLVLTMATFLIVVIGVLMALGLLFLVSPLLVAGAVGALIIGGKVALLLLVIGLGLWLAGPRHSTPALRSLLHGQKSGFRP